MTSSKPRAFEEFTKRFPGLDSGWQQLGRASRDGPLDERTVALVKLALAIGSGLEGPVHSATRKALSAACPEEEIEQVAALAASTLGLPRSVAAWTWMRDVTRPTVD